MPVPIPETISTAPAPVPRMPMPLPPPAYQLGTYNTGLQTQRFGFANPPNRFVPVSSMGNVGVQQVMPTYVPSEAVVNPSYGINQYQYGIPFNPLNSSGPGQLQHPLPNISNFRPNLPPPTSGFPVRQPISMVIRAPRKVLPTAVTKQL